VVACTSARLPFVGPPAAGIDGTGRAVVAVLGERRSRLFARNGADDWRAVTPVRSPFGVLIAADPAGGLVLADPASGRGPPGSAAWRPGRG